MSDIDFIDKASKVKKITVTDCTGQAIEKPWHQEPYSGTNMYFINNNQ